MVQLVHTMVQFYVNLLEKYIIKSITVYMIIIGYIITVPTVPNVPSYFTT